MALSDDEDLESLRNAVFASIQDKTNAIASDGGGDDELAQLRAAALQTSADTHQDDFPHTGNTFPKDVPNKAIKFIGDKTPESNTLPNTTPSLSKIPGRNLIVIDTKDELFTDVSTNSVPLRRPQDKWLSDNNSSGSTPTKTKGSSKFNRFESSDSESFSSSSSDEELSEQFSPSSRVTHQEPLSNVVPESSTSIPSSLSYVPSISVSITDIPMPEERPIIRITMATGVRDLVASRSHVSSVTPGVSKSLTRVADKHLTTSATTHDKSLPVDNRNSMKTFLSSDTSVVSASAPSCISSHTVDEKPSILQRLGVKYDSESRTEHDRNIPFQKSSLIYDILEKNTPKLLRRYKSDCRGSLSANNESNTCRDNENLSSRENIILEARKKKFESRNPITEVNKTLSLKVVSDKHSTRRDKLAHGSNATFEYKQNNSNEKYIGYSNIDNDDSGVHPCKKTPTDRRKGPDSDGNLYFLSAYDKTDEKFSTIPINQYQHKHKSKLKQDDLNRAPKNFELESSRKPIKSRITSSERAGGGGDARKRIKADHRGTAFGDGFDNNYNSNRRIIDKTSDDYKPIKRQRSPFTNIDLRGHESSQDFRNSGPFNVGSTFESECNNSYIDDKRRPYKFFEERDESDDASHGNKKLASFVCKRNFQRVQRSLSVSDSSSEDDSAATTSKPERSRATSHKNSQTTKKTKKKSKEKNKSPNPAELHKNDKKRTKYDKVSSSSRKDKLRKDNGSTQRKLRSGGDADDRRRYSTKTSGK